MAEVTSAASTPGPRPRRHWLRALRWLVGLFVVLCLGLYFVASSPAFFIKQVLPRISRSLNAKVTVSSVDINMFSQIVLHDLKIQPSNQPPLLTAHEVRIKYRLSDVLGGNIRLTETDLVLPVFQLVKNVDGTSNLDPVKKAVQENARQSGKPSRPLQIDIGKILLSDATFRRIQNQKAGTRDLVEFTNADVTVTGVRNGGQGKLEFSSIVRNENNPPAPAMYGLLSAKVDGGFDFALTPELNPGFILGDAQLHISQAAGSFSDFSKLNGTLHCDVSATEFKTVALSFEKGGLRLGELRATGPYDIEKAEGRLNVELLSVDKQVLNLFGARYGIDFGSTTMTSTNSIELTETGAVIAAAGELRASNFQLSRTNESTPPLEVHAYYNVFVNKLEKTALLRALNLTGSQNGRLLLRGELASPMTLAWGNTTNAVGDSSLNVAISRLKIADWRSFAGNLASAGTLDLNMKLLSQRGGTELTFDGTNRIENLATQIGGQRITDATVLLWARGRATNMEQFYLRQFSLQLVQSNQTALAISGSGVYGRSNATADLEVAMDTSLPRALRLLNQPDLTASRGTGELKARVTQRQRTQTVTGNLVVTGFAGRCAGYDFTNFGATMNLDMEKTPDRIDFHKVAGRLANTRGSNSTFELSGIYSLPGKSSQFTMSFSDFDQENVRPFVEPLLNHKKLVSIALNGTASVQANRKGNSSVQADLQISNLVLSNLVLQTRSTPLEAKVQLDAGISNQIIELRQLQVGLTPTVRATNQFQVLGRVDMSQTNNIHGRLRLKADALDLTSYYDLLNGTNEPVLTAKSAVDGRNRPQNAPHGNPPSEPELEPATNRLPFSDFTVEASVREIYLREVAGSNLLAAAKFDGGRVVLKPFQVTMGSSPLFASADVDMGVPGWKYALTVNATNIPFAPLWNTFNPERKGEVNGRLTAYGDINGTGTSGESLQKTLAGNFHVGTTNLNLDVRSIRSRMLLGVVGVVAATSEIIGNPLEAALNLVENAITGKLSGSLSPDVKKSPIDVISLEGTAGKGQIILQRAIVRSDVFEATATSGTITLAPVWTNSAIDIPIDIALSSAVAPRVSNLDLMNTQTNNNYIKLPAFFSERGTVGDPKRNIDVIALTKGMVKETIPDLGVGTNSLAHSLEHIGNLFYGGTNASQPGDNQLPGNIPLNRPVVPMGK